MTYQDYNHELELLRRDNERLRRILADRVQESALTCSREVALKFMEKFSGDMQENFSIVLLDNKHRSIREVRVTRGTLNQSLVHPREVFAPAIEYRAAAIICVHNHPSGCTEPSNQDLQITKRLIEVGEIVGIRVLDHLIIGGGSYLSFVDASLMEY